MGPFYIFRRSLSWAHSNFTFDRNWSFTRDLSIRVAEFCYNQQQFKANTLLQHTSIIYRWQWGSWTFNIDQNQGNTMKNRNQIEIGRVNKMRREESMAMVMRMIGISSVGLLSVNHIDRNSLPIVDHSEIGHSIQHRFCPIGHVTKLRCPIVLKQHVDSMCLIKKEGNDCEWEWHEYLRESVMEIVSSLSSSLDVGPHRFHGTYRGIVRFVSEHVSSRVDQAEMTVMISTLSNALIDSKRSASENHSQGWIKCEDVSEDSCNVESDEWGFAPEEGRNEGGKNETDESCKRKIVSERWFLNDAIVSLVLLCTLAVQIFYWYLVNWPSLECENRVVPQIGNIDLRSHFLQFLALSCEEPSNVRIEESSSRVVGIGLSVRPFVMASMITSPFDNVILKEENGD